MAVNPLATKPVPPNSNFMRALWAWVTGVSSQDPLYSDANSQALINFCGTTGCNVVFLDIWRYLGGGNWTTANVTRMKTFIDAASKSGIHVWALAGNAELGLNQSWVKKNIIKPILDYNLLVPNATQRFQGIMLDVEYWTDPNAYPAEANCAGLCDLVKSIKEISALPVGLFAAFYLKDSTGARASISYNGISQQDGAHFMDTADLVAVGTYRNHAADNGQDGPGQISLFQPWYDYAEIEGRNFALLVGSETTNVSPSYITYYGMTKAAMETEHTAISSAFQVGTDAVFHGQCVHSYDGWKAMT